jgi:uncharacterized membrane protein YedE/YeeE
MKRILARHWSYVPTGTGLAALLIIFWYFNQSYLAPGKGTVAQVLENPMLTFGLIIFGAYVGAFVSGEFSVKVPMTIEPLVLSLAGGFIAGMGAVIAGMSVHSVVLFNLAGVFTLPAFMITKGWIYAGFMVLGGLAASKLLVLIILKTAPLKKEIPVPEVLRSRKIQRILFYILVVFLGVSLLVILFLQELTYSEKTGFVLAMLLLILFGFVAERGTICMSSMLKEWFISHSAYVWRSVLFTVMCLALLYQAGLKLSLYEPIELERYIPNLGLLLVGSFLLGFGFIFADGCFIGSLWKAGQGNVINLAGILGLLMGVGGSGMGKAILVKLPIVTTSLIPNYLSSGMSPLLFLIILWVAGLLLLMVLKQKRYRY